VHLINVANSAAFGAAAQSKPSLREAGESGSAAPGRRQAAQRSTSDWQGTVRRPKSCPKSCEAEGSAWPEREPGRPSYWPGPAAGPSRHSGRVGDGASRDSGLV